MSITPDGPSPGGDPEPGYGPYDDSEFRRTNPTQVPGIFLVVVGFLSLLTAGFMIFRGVQVSNTPVGEIQRQLDEMKQALPWAFAGQNLDAQEVKDQSKTSMFVLGGIGVVTALLIILGGFRMQALESYNLALTSAVLAAIPCVGGCCVLGQIAGIWAIVVLLKPEVKALFR